MKRLLSIMISLILVLQHACLLPMQISENKYNYKELALMI